MKREFLREKFSRLTSSIYSHREFDSTINGKVGVFTFFGQHTVITGSIQQNGPYLGDMWRDAVKHIKVNSRASGIKKILMLGLGGGQGVEIFYKDFPQCEITVVEHDPIMIKIAQEIRKYKPPHMPLIVEGDAFVEARKMKESFDLIILDIFSPTGPSVLDKDISFLESLKNILNPDGLMVANVYNHPEYLDVMSNQFKTEELWAYQLNKLGLFSN